MKVCTKCGKVYRFRKKCCARLTRKVTGEQAKQSKKNRKAWERNNNG